MFQLRRRGPVGYEDLLQDLEVIERHLLGENSALAMELMVLDAKIRERFYWMERQAQQMAMPTAPEAGLIGTPDPFAGNDISIEELRMLIPRDLPPFPNMDVVDETRHHKQKLETVGMAAVLAMITAIGVFGLASVLQLALSWLL